jgi:hypothetical protein
MYYKKDKSQLLVKSQVSRQHITKYLCAAFKIIMLNVKLYKKFAFEAFKKSVASFKDDHLLVKQGFISVLDSLKHIPLPNVVRVYA